MDMPIIIMINVTRRFVQQVLVLVSACEKIDGVCPGKALQRR